MTRKRAASNAVAILDELIASVNPREPSWGVLSRIRGMFVAPDPPPVMLTVPPKPSIAIIPRKRYPSAATAPPVKLLRKSDDLVPLSELPIPRHRGVIEWEFRAIESCYRCVYAKPNPESYIGYECRIEKHRDCCPLGPAQYFQER